MREGSYSISRPRPEAGPGSIRSSGTPREAPWVGCSCCRRTGWNVCPQHESSGSSALLAWPACSAFGACACAPCLSFSSVPPRLYVLFLQALMNRTETSRAACQSRCTGPTRGADRAENTGCGGGERAPSEKDPQPRYRKRYSTRPPARVSIEKARAGPAAFDFTGPSG